MDEPHRLSYGEKTTVTWTFKQADDGTTHVHLEQTGFKAEQAFNGVLYGWQRMVNQLERVLVEL
ncbi:SRPBCC family protein [Alicyclobacillus shizuokensis]|uniref:SRPBCC family protein n=1 Tax=Alicyclobacillus shizuokensis TaxID=392014 RepID=UPI000AC1226B|nr:SRPBCC domain-containing protein [Alicyclobacillus shizuokensis]